jgi:hypothetical protein
MLDQPERGRWMGENGRKLVESDFGWEEIARRTERVYDADANGRYRVQADEDCGARIDDDSQAELLRVPSELAHRDRGLTSCVLTMSTSRGTSPLSSSGTTQMASTKTFDESTSCRPSS